MRRRIGFLMQEMGASGTPLMYAFREREKILDLFEEPDRIAHDVQLHALWRLPRGLPRRLARCGAQGGGRAAADSWTKFEALLTRQRNPDGAHARASAC